jgi:hypothetical protein
MTAGKTCRWTVAREGAFAKPCGRPAEWEVAFNDDGDYGAMPVCDAHLVDAQDAADYVGARAL